MGDFEGKCGTGIWNGMGPKDRKENDKGEQKFPSDWTKMFSRIEKALYLKGNLGGQSDM